MDVMTHSSTFLLPGNDHSSSVTYALVVLNQRLPRFTPILWDHGSVSLVAFSFFAICLPPCMRERDKVFCFWFLAVCNSTGAGVCWWRCQSVVRRNASLVPPRWRSWCSTQVTLCFSLPIQFIERLILRFCFCSDFTIGLNLKMNFIETKTKSFSMGWWIHGWINHDFLDWDKKKMLGNFRILESS